jgi:hypothetical protein
LVSAFSLFAASVALTVFVGLTVLNVVVVVGVGVPVDVTVSAYDVLNSSAPVDVQVVPSLASFPETADVPWVSVTAVTTAPSVAVTVTGSPGETPVAAAAGAITSFPGALATVGDDEPADDPGVVAPGLGDQWACADVEQPLITSTAMAAIVATAPNGAFRVRLVIWRPRSTGGG